MPADSNRRMRVSQSLRMGKGRITMKPVGGEGRREKGEGEKSERERKEGGEG
jgi:hypothetical protein